MSINCRLDLESESTLESDNALGGIAFDNLPTTGSDRVEQINVGGSLIASEEPQQSRQGSRSCGLTTTFVKEELVSFDGELSVSK